MNALLVPGMEGDGGPIKHVNGYTKGSSGHI